MSLAAYLALCIAVVLLIVGCCFVYVKSTTPLDRMTGRDWRITGLMFAPVIFVIIVILVAG